MRLFRPLLIVLLVLSLIVMWGVGELLTSQEVAGRVPPVLQFLVFIIVSLLSVFVLTYFIQNRKKGVLNEHDSGKR